MTKNNIYFALTCAILIVANLYLNVREWETETPPQKPIDTIPFHLNSFRGSDTLYDHNGFDSTSADHWILRNYTRDGVHMPILFYLGYWNNQNEQKKVKPPRFTKEGWSYLKIGSKRIGPGPPAMHMKTFLKERGAEQELVYYCYLIDGKIIGNDYVFRTLNLLNSVLYGRTNAGLLRVSMPVTATWNLEKAESYAEEFLKETLPFLVDYFEKNAFENVKTG